MRLKTLRTLKATALILIGALAASLWWGYLLIEHSWQDARMETERVNRELSIVIDRRSEDVRGNQDDIR